MRRRGVSWARVAWASNAMTTNARDKDRRSIDLIIALRASGVEWAAMEIARENTFGRAGETPARQPAPEPALQALGGLPDDDYGVACSILMGLVMKHHQ